MQTRAAAPANYPGPVTPTVRAVAAAAASAALVFALAACTAGPSETSAATPTETAPAVLDGACADGTGVTVTVDSSVLDDGDSTTWCIGTDDALVAADALARAGIETEGTAEYGDQVLCRVDGVPAEDVALPAEDGSEYFERCESMPAAFAYWSMWVKPASGEWRYAEEGLATQQLEPGESLALLFVLDGEPAAPAS